MKHKARLVRYVGLWASPAWLPEDQARALLEREDRQYVEMNAAGMRVQALVPGGGPPRIERPDHV